MEAIDFLLNGSIAKNLKASDKDLLDRLWPLTNWLNACSEQGLDPYCKQSDGPIGAECNAKDRHGRRYFGINLASQDYLSLASHPAIMDAAKLAVDRFGVHSAGSPALMGNSVPSIQLESRLADFLALKECTVFSTGWAAGYGLIRAVVREGDHIVIDRLAHASLMEGARSATRNLHVFPHLSCLGLEERLKRIRVKDSSTGILVVTESLFSMDSDTPDLEAHQRITKEHNATLMVDVAHDLGCMGKTGRGFLEVQNMVGKVDIVMGSFSKTFAANGGFVASNHPALKLALRAACGPHTFSNAISPIQASVVLKAIELIDSNEGAQRRDVVLQNAMMLRELLTQGGFEVLGAPSPIIPLVLGAPSRARLITRRMLEHGAFVNLVEYPAVAKNASRYRLQVMASHTAEQLRRFAAIFCAAAHHADLEFGQLLEQSPSGI